ncbi:MAG: hypothetical protein AUI21_08230 [Nitrospirae bacterium 13_1_40CM_2_62_10]|nr:MAG: hypothetical protein AUI21_08230 [Nitrospirae bacterium 13_1_40CM_2_62_10]
MARARFLKLHGFAIVSNIFLKLYCHLHGDEEVIMGVIAWFVEPYGFPIDRDGAIQISLGLQGNGQVVIDPGIVVV